MLIKSGSRDEHRNPLASHQDGARVAPQQRSILRLAKSLYHISKACASPFHKKLGKFPFFSTFRAIFEVDLVSFVPFIGFYAFFRFFLQSIPLRQTLPPKKRLHKPSTDLWQFCKRFAKHRFSKRLHLQPNLRKSLVPSEARRQGSCRTWNLKIEKETKK